MHDEAGRAKARGVLLPVRIDAVSEPIGFGEVQSLDLVGWRGNPRDRRFRNLVAAAKALVAGGPRPRPVTPARRAGLLAAWSSGLAIAMALLGFAADVAGLQAQLCRVPGVRAVCSARGLGGVPTAAEEALWTARPAGDCAGLRRYLDRFPRGAYAEEAQRRLQAAESVTDESWKPEEHFLPLTVRAGLDPFAGERRHAPTLSRALPRRRAPRARASVRASTDSSPRPPGPRPGAASPAARASPAASTDRPCARCRPGTWTGARCAIEVLIAPLPESFALCCRSCGAPRSPRSAECAHCGSTEQPDAATLARLRAHRARMRRALQQLRAIGTARVASVLLRGKLPWLIGLFLGLPILSFFVAVAVLLLCLAVGGTDGPLALAGAFAATAIGTLGSWAGIVAAYQLYKRAAERAAAEARDVVLGMTATTPAVCPQCGGHAAVVALGWEESCVCPWCAAALLARDADLAERFTRAELARMRLSPAVRPPPLAGYELTGGGTLVRGHTDGVPLCAWNEIVDGVFVLRVEAAVETGLAGETWIVRPDVETALRKVTDGWGYALPAQPTASPAAGWLAYAEPQGAAAPAAAAVAAAVARLGPADALLLDPAGLSLWRQATGLTAAWGVLVEHHTTLAGLARELAPSP